MSSDVHKPMTDEELDEIERIADAALDGPWEAGPTPVYLASGQFKDGRSRREHPITIRSPYVHTEEIATVWNYLLPTEANATFIANSRMAVPRLIAEVRRLHAEIKQHQEYSDKLVDTLPCLPKDLEILRSENDRLRKELLEVVDRFGLEEAGEGVS